MAKSTIILRPIADVSVEHTLPEGCAGAWALVNDVIADGSATCLGVRSDGKDGEEISAVSVVEASCGAAVRVKSIESVKIICSCRVDVGHSAFANACVDTSISLNNVSSTSLDYSVGGFNYEDSFSEHVLDINSTNSVDFLSELDNYINTHGGALPNLLVKLITTANGESTSENSKGTSADASAYITQVCVEITCDIIEGIGISQKIDGEYKAATAAYQKVGGAWSEISEVECKSILQNNIITEGVK